METAEIKLTEEDRLILESYKQIVEGLSDYLGPAFEIVLHSLGNLNASVIKIINGHHTGRKEGAPITDLALSMLAQMREDGELSHITYFAKNKCNQPIKSSTIAIRGNSGKTIGLLCMNMYLDTPLSAILGSLVSQPQTTLEENFALEKEDIVQKAVQEARARVISDATISKGNRNKEIVWNLNEQGIFHLKDAVSEVAELLKISRNTVYMHLRAVECAK